jgi:fructose-1,6-bisphosphatase/inositol monophosphatase family enzyme
MFCRDSLTPPPIDNSLLGMLVQTLVRDNGRRNGDFGQQVIRRVAGLYADGSADMALCQVAAGRLDGYAEQYIGQWDYMAGSLIVTEAGGMVTDYDGSTDFTQGNSVVATNGLIQQDLLKVIGETKNNQI